MQRVAIARALVNNPDILLADEPTGALDSETSIQVMELLKDVAKDRLVVMVTHNPELAEQYANRIVRLRDGLITDDTRPFEPDDTKLAPPIHKNMGRSSMSLLTSLALTISGVSGAERRRRAAEALRQVGLGDQLHKRPTEMSGGQMQRVAIARALVNNPDILLADEPTGALDSETSIQVMELLKEVARDRLVVMVTHNPELAERYATRIVNLKDGVIRSDTMPYEPEDEAAAAAPVHRNMGHSSMSLLTSLSLCSLCRRTKHVPAPRNA